MIRPAIVSSLSLLTAAIGAQAIVYPLQSPRAEFSVVAGSDLPIANRYWGGTASDGTRMFVFGGRGAPNGTADSNYYNGLYAYDATTNTWTTLSAEGDPNAPSNRFRVGMCYDPIFNRIVIYGGGNHVLATTYSDCYVFDLGTNSWSQIANPTPGTTGPQSLYDCRLAYDATSSGLVLFGGQVDWGDSGAPISTRVFDTWLLFGTAWVPVTGLTEGVDVPTARRMHAMCSRSAPYDDVVVTLGQGNGNNALHPDDTWRWDGAASTWVQIATANSSVPVTWASGNDMVYDAVREVLVLPGGPGTNIAPSNTTNNGGWHSEFDCVADEWRIFGANTTSQLADDPVIGRLQRTYVTFANGKVLVWGGQNSSTVGDTELTLVKEYQASVLASATPYGAGCNGLSLTAGRLPWSGHDWTLDGAGFSATAVGALSFSLGQASVPMTALTPAAMAGCDLLLNPQLYVGSVVLFPVGGAASFGLRLPIFAGAGGLPLNAQLFALDANVITSSNGIAGVYGPN